MELLKMFKLYPENLTLPFSGPSYIYIYIYILKRITLVLIHNSIIKIYGDYLISWFQYPSVIVEYLVLIVETS